MRDQYAADVSDLLKFAFLRALAAHDRSIGVGWYYNSTNDGRPDGRHREYCGEPKWKALDAALFDALVALPNPPSVRGLENLQIWPQETRFHRVPVPPSGSREAWASNMVGVLQEADIVFLDPDNGVGKESERHATLAEIAAMRRPGRTVVLIKFPGRGTTHAEQIEEHHTSLPSGSGALSAVTVRTNVFVNSGGLTRGIPRARWFTLVDADNLLIERAEQFAARLNGIDKCSAHVVHGSEKRAAMREAPAMPGGITSNARTPTGAKATPPISIQSRIAQPPTAGEGGRVPNVCPECVHQFKGHGFDGIDAHWRAKHEAVMPYKEAWPLIKSGNYRRPKNSRT